MAGEDGGDRGALPLAAGEVAGVARGDGLQAELLEDFPGGFLLLRAAQGELDLFFDGGPVEEGGRVLGQVRDPAVDGSVHLAAERLEKACPLRERQQVLEAVLGDHGGAACSWNRDRAARTSLAPSGSSCEVGSSS